MTGFGSWRGGINRRSSTWGGFLDVGNRRRFQARRRRVRLDRLGARPRPRLCRACRAAGRHGQRLGFNQFGQIGNGVTSSTGCECANVPTAPMSLSEVVQVSGGRELTLALLANGTVKSWGSNSLGNLGDGSTTASNTPVSVTGLSNAVQVAAGGYGGMALLADGTVRAWGEDTDGQLGLGSLADRVHVAPRAAKSRSRYPASPTWWRSTPTTPPCSPCEPMGR